MKIVESEARSSTAQHRMDEPGYATYLQDTGNGAIFSENFSSIRSELSSPLEHKNIEKDETNVLSYES